MKKAIIYCRVSSEKQVTEGHGLDSQEHRCKQYADSNGYDVVKIFRDEGISGGIYNRKELNNMFNYMDKYPYEQFILIVDAIDRIARGLDVHTKIIGELKARNVIIKSPNFIFEDTPEGNAMTGVTAVFAQYHKESNRRQVLQKQKARLERGYWCFFSTNRI